MTSNVRVFLPAQPYRPQKPGEVRWDLLALDYLPHIVKLNPRLISYALPGVDLTDPDSPWTKYAEHFVTPCEPVYSIVIAPPSVLPAMHTPMLQNICITGAEGMQRHEGHMAQMKGYEVLIPYMGTYIGSIVPPEDFERWWFEFTKERS